MFVLIESLFAFLSLAIILYALGKESALLHPNCIVSAQSKSWVDKYMIWIIIVYSIVCGLRYQFGTDTEEYVGLLHGRSSNSRELDDIEFIPRYIIYFSQSIDLGRVPFLAIWASLEMLLLMLALKTRKFLLPFVLMVLILGSFFQVWNNGLRQVIASLLFLYAVVVLIDEKKWKNYLFLLVLACLFHSSAIILIPLISIYFCKSLPKRKYAFAVLGICVFLGTTTFLDEYFNQIEYLLNVVGYSSYSYRLDYFMEMETNITSYGPRRIIQLLSYILIIFYSPQIRKMTNHDKFFDVSFWLFLVYACGTEALFSKNTLFTRPFLYFYPFVLICLGYVLYYLKRYKNILLYFIGIIITCSYNIVATIAEYSKPTANIFQFIFFKS